MRVHRHVHRHVRLYPRMSASMSACLIGSVAGVRAVAKAKTASTKTASTSSARMTIRAHSAGHGHGEMAAGGGAATAQGGHGHGHGGMMSDRRPGEKKGFVEEMRFVAMKLHTREQAPKEGKAEPAKEAKPMMQWQPTKEGYLRFLVESKAVYDAMEQIVASGASPMYGDFVDTGLERAEVLAADIEWFCQTYEMTAPVADGPGAEYARFLKDLSTTAPPEFICHFYNVYFAHSAGGRMIGRKVSEMILDDKELAFYKWEKPGGLEAQMTRTKAKLNDAAEKWSREEKDRCLEETGKSFELSGKLLRLIA